MNVTLTRVNVPTRVSIRWVVMRAHVIEISRETTVMSRSVSAILSPAETVLCALTFPGGMNVSVTMVLLVRTVGVSRNIAQAPRALMEGHVSARCITSRVTVQQAGKE